VGNSGAAALSLPPLLPSHKQTKKARNKNDCIAIFSDDYNVVVILKRSRKKINRYINSIDYQEKIFLLNGLFSKSVAIRLKNFSGNRD
jgi:hypothetical protein